MPLVTVSMCDQCSSDYILGKPEMCASVIEVTEDFATEGPVSFKCCGAVWRHESHLARFQRQIQDEKRRRAR